MNTNHPTSRSKETQPPTAIGFPPPLLGDEPYRLPILGLAPDWVAITKPRGIAMREHPWTIESPNLDSALNAQLQNAKPELLRLPASCFGSIYALEPEYSGVALFGLNRNGIASLREAYGDGQITSEFHFATRGDGGPAERVIQAPLMPHNTKAKMIPSSAKGKKCTTTFARLAQNSTGWELWSAKLGLMRPHQVRLHAALAGIPIMGDEIYDGPAVPSLYELDSRKHGAGAKVPLFDGLAAHLQGIKLPEISDSINSPLPKRLAACFKRMSLPSTTVR